MTAPSNARRALPALGLAFGLCLHAAATSAQAATPVPEQAPPAAPAEAPPVAPAPSATAPMPSVQGPSLQAPHSLTRSTSPRPDAPPVRARNAEPVEAVVSAPVARPPTEPRMRELPGPFTVGIGLGLLGRADQGFDLLAEPRATAEGHLFAGYDHALTPCLRLGVDLQWGFSGGGRDDLADERVESSWFEHRVLVGGTLALRVSTLFWPHIGVAAGMGALHLRIEDSVDGAAAVDQWRRMAVGEVRGGFTVYVPVGRDRAGVPPLAAGFRLEGGYALSSAADITLDRSSASVRAPLGDLHLGGGFARLSALLRF